MADEKKEVNVYGKFCNNHPIIGGTAFCAGATLGFMLITELAANLGKLIVNAFRKKK